VLPNGSRLSGGANAGRRKHPALRYLGTGAQTFASSGSRPRQLQALVRRPLHRRNQRDYRKSQIVRIPRHVNAMTKSTAARRRFKSAVPPENRCTSARP